MPRLHFPDQALVRRLVEAAVTSGKPLMLAHDHGLYLCTDAMREPDGTCVCAFVKGCDPRQNAAAFEVANYLVGHDDFGISFPMGGQEQLLADLKRGHRLAIDFGRRAVAIVMKAPPTKQSQPTPTARGRGAESHPTARNKDSTMTTTATKKKTATKAAPKKSGERLKNEARAEIAKRIATLDAGGDPSAEATATEATSATTGATAAPVAKGKASTKPKATKAKDATDAKPAKPAKAAKPKRLSALDAAATVLKTAKEPMNTADLIVEMANRKLWTSPNGATPEQTLYAAMSREIKTKGKDARFTKTDRGHFAFNGKAS